MNYDRRIPFLFALLLSACQSDAPTAPRANPSVSSTASVTLSAATTASTKVVAGTHFNIRRVGDEFFDGARGRRVADQARQALGLVDEFARHQQSKEQSIARYVRWQVARGSDLGKQFEKSPAALNYLRVSEPCIFDAARWCDGELAAL